MLPGRVEEHAAWNLVELNRFVVVCGLWSRNHRQVVDRQCKTISDLSQRDLSVISAPVAPDDQEIGFGRESSGKNRRNQPQDNRNCQQPKYRHQIPGRVIDQQDDDHAAQYVTLILCVVLAGFVILQEIRVRNLEDGNIPRIRSYSVEAGGFGLLGKRGGMKIHEKTGEPYLLFYGENEKPLAGIGVKNGAGRVFVVDRDGIERELP